MNTTTNYLIYALFPKQSLTESHLADTIRYSREFFADLVSLLVLDLNIDDRCKPIIQNYIPITSATDLSIVPAELVGCFSP